MSLVGISSTVISLTMYTSIIYLIPEKHYGVAYGILESIKNLGLSIGPLVIGTILDEEVVDASEFIDLYSSIHIVLLVLAAIGVVLSVLMLLVDANNKNILNRVGNLDEEIKSDESSEESLKNSLDLIK
jgi:MFS family permease